MPLSSIAAGLYCLIAQARNRAYDAGMLSVKRFEVPVISIGNITAGGTGKTPMTVHVARHIIDTYCCKIGVVSRGYKRQTRGSFVVSAGTGSIANARTGGDEPVLMAKKLPEAVVIADKKRARGCRRAIDEFGCEVLLLDDAFQHRSCGRDLDIVLFDASTSERALHMLPKGRLREPLRNLARAGLVVVSKAENEASCRNAMERIREYAREPIPCSSFAPIQYRDLETDAMRPLASLEELPVLAFCGIAAPESFRNTLATLRVDCRDLHPFPDHHTYTLNDVSLLAEKARSMNTQTLLTTEKDATRLAELKPDLGGLQVLALEMEVRFLNGGDRLYEAIAQCIRRKKN